MSKPNDRGVSTVSKSADLLMDGWKFDWQQAMLLLTNVGLVQLVSICV